MIHLGSTNSIANDLLQKVTVRKNWKATGESSRQCSGEQGRRENGRRHMPDQAQNFTEVLQGIEQGGAAQETCLYWSFEAIVLTAM